MKSLVHLISFVVVGAMLSACSGPSLSGDQKKLAESSLKFAEEAVKTLDKATSSEEVEAELGKLLTGDAKAGFDFVVKVEGVDAKTLEEALTSESLALFTWHDGEVKARYDAVRAALAKASKEKADLFDGPLAQRFWKAYADRNTVTEPWKNKPAAPAPAEEPTPTPAEEPTPTPAEEPTPTPAEEPTPTPEPN